MVYLDNAATTFVSELAAETANSVLCEFFANPAALYAQGAKSERCLNDARSKIAGALYCKQEEVYFTGCGSESNNIAILGAAKARKAWGENIVVSGFEHPSVHLAVDALKADGFEIRVINPEQDGNISIDKLVKAVDNKTALLCCMHINNETGSVTDVKRLAKEVKQKNTRTAVHIDGVQAFCKTELKLQSTLIDSYAVSGHKLNAPKGIGALYLRKSYNITPVMYGGGQERGMRPGTENIAYAAAFAAAVGQAKENYSESRIKIKNLSDLLWKQLEQIPQVVRNSPLNAVADIANISVLNIKSETMLHFLEEKGIMVSAGSACSKGKLSHTLKAMGLNNERIEGALRISFSKENSISDVEAFVIALQDGIKNIAKIKR